MIYISTHGSSPDEKLEGVNYIVAHDTDPDDVCATGIAMQDLTRIIKSRVNTDRVVIVMDACHSGSVASDSKGMSRSRNIDAGSVLQGCGQIVICSSEPGQVSWESKSYQNGVFTKQLLDGLRSKGQQTTIGDAYKVMKNRTEQEVTRDRGVLQSPVMKSKWQGKPLIIAIAPTERRDGLPVNSPNFATKPASITSPAIGITNQNNATIKVGRVDQVDFEKALGKSHDVERLADKMINECSLGVIVLSNTIYGDTTLFYRDAIDLVPLISQAMHDESEPKLSIPEKPAMSVGYFDYAKIDAACPEVGEAVRRNRSCVERLRGLSPTEKADLVENSYHEKASDERISESFNRAVSTIASRRGLSFVIDFVGVGKGKDIVKEKGTDITSELITELKK